MFTNMVRDRNTTKQLRVNKDKLSFKDFLGDQCQVN